MKASQGKIKMSGSGRFRLLLPEAAKCLCAVCALLLPVSEAGGSWPESCRQAVVVLTADWTAREGSLAAFDLQGAEWRATGETIPVTVGHKGLGWGVGLHGERKSNPMKTEGDRRAPAGIFLLEFGFGALPFKERKFPFRQVSERDRWVDDPTSRFYNQWTVLNDPRFPRDWSSAEVMKRPDGIYDYVIVVGHNRRPTVPGRGSAIFMHSWSSPGKSTIGCTAMEKAGIKRLLRWLDLEAAPVLIQIPVGELGTLEIPSNLKTSIAVSLP